MYYLETYHLKYIREFCQGNCKDIINHEDKTNVELWRGKFKGFTYGISTTNYLISQVNRRTKPMELHAHFKEQQTKVQFDTYRCEEFQEGVKESILKIIEYVKGLN